MRYNKLKQKKPKAIFFDCDDCLYFDGWRLANQLTQKIDDWCTNPKGPALVPGKAYELYKTYGTALNGLIAERHIPHTKSAIEAFLHSVHDVPIEQYLSPDIQLQTILEKIDPSIPKFIFTASSKEHASRCIKALGISHMFTDIIDTKACNLVSKHSVESFQVAMDYAKLTHDPQSCLFFDDNLNNINTGHQLGWRCVLVGKIGRDCGTTISSNGKAEFELENIYQLNTIMDQLMLCSASSYVPLGGALNTKVNRPSIA